ncbi:hypothetical protein BDY17DRAFT_298207 [Neohortaea acidophila]|uniref:DUF3752 domain-containing protein n=1 Tax=Neohortaea acidophila TaxID=245834 RepID=A0A6A6PR28_9PEZI|nr:uncharacterized protein BDY17DRAFT_298207 [Neohortaea acidophila]KAF2482256.1 hypothetical protein BDY17DRAFT_298207 [Neohortaea acidophila]
MSGIGPALPPHLLAKRKRKQEEEADNATQAASGATASLSPGDGEKRRRVLGPAMPPAPLDERPEQPPDSSTRSNSDSDDDDDYGPALPSSFGNGNVGEDTSDADKHTQAEQPEAAPREEKLQRDEWMTMPPKQDDLAARLDPTKPRPRGFNTSKGANGPNAAAADGSAWHETPEQKQKRLADEMMGVTTSNADVESRATKGPRKAADHDTARKIKEHTDKIRGPSLVHQHQSSQTREPDDDPSARAFDREKDMGSGGRLGHAERREMLNKAANFSSKFSGGSYL